MRNSFQILTNEKSGSTRSLALNIVKSICADENCNLTCCFYWSCQRILGHILNLCKTPLHCPLYSKSQQLFQGLENVECNNRKTLNEPKCKGQLLTMEKWTKTPSTFLSASIFHASIIHQNSSAQIPLIWQCAWSHTTMHLFSSRNPGAHQLFVHIFFFNCFFYLTSQQQRCLIVGHSPSHFQGSNSRTCFRNVFSHLWITMFYLFLQRILPSPHHHEFCEHWEGHPHRRIWFTRHCLTQILCLMVKQINHPHVVLPCCSHPQTESMDPTSHSPSSTWPAWPQAWDTKVIISSPMPSWYIHSKGRGASFWKPIHCQHALPRDGIMHGHLVECSLYLHPPCFHNLCKHGGCN